MKKMLFIIMLIMCFVVSVLIGIEILELTELKKENSIKRMIDSDKSVGPYITFATKFKSHIVESLLLSIYQMVDNGENVSQFSEFDILFGNIRNNFQEDLVDGKKRALDTFNSFPLIGAGFVTIALSISILSVITDLLMILE